jgi:hypothetical protein
MSKLWIFGDSYSVPRDYAETDLGIKAGVDRNIYTTNWIQEVEKKLNVDDLKIYSNFGVSNEWIFKNVMEQSNNFSPDDYVIIQLTNGNRHWWFPEHPAESNLPQLVSHPDWSKDKRKAIELHLKYLQNDQMDNLIYSATIYSFLYIKLALPGIQLLFLPGWGAAPETIGNLTNNVCDAEFDDNDTQQKFYSKTGFDCRLNHMSINNHYVLADKIYDYFSNHIPVDLTTGFETNIYTKTNI